MTGFLWITIPIISNILINDVINDESQINKSVEKINVLNLWYPITSKTYNSFYNVFYIMECVMVMYSAYGLVTFDLFLIAILQLISTQYEIISAAFENLKFEYKNNDGEFKS